MSDSLLIQRGRVMDPSQDLDGDFDLLIEDGRIAAIEKPGTIPSGRARKQIQAKDQWVLPGFVDVHVHLREPGLEYKETIATGARAAVAGGFTTVCCMANTKPVNDSPYVTAFIRERAKEAACRVFPIGAISKGLKGEELAEIGGMVDEGARAISDDGMPVMNSYLMRKAMDYSKAFGIPVISHAEDGHLVGKGVMNEGPLSNELGLRGNPAAAEEIMVAREIALCRLTGAKVHIAHVSTALAVDLIKRAKEEGLPLTAEVTPHHLTLTEEAVRTYDTHCRMNPPLRTEKDRIAVREALASGVIDMIATDHAPHASVDKQTEFTESAPGLIGLQTAIPLTLQMVHAGEMSLERWVESLTSAPATLFGLPHGTLQKGAAADLVLFDPNEEWTYSPSNNQSKSHNTPYMGQTMKGLVKATWVGGEMRYGES